MNDEEFTELVNLYFDREISARDLERLKSEIAARSDRKRAFAERRRLDEAMRMALRPDYPRSRRSSSPSRRSRRSSANRRRSNSRDVAGSTRISRYDESFSAPGASVFPRWLLASGVVASLLMAFTLLQPVFRDTIDPRAQPKLVGASASELKESDPLADLDQAELRRFATARQQREAAIHASLAAQMRLMGLRPELTPADKQLREVGMAAHYRPGQNISQAELLQRLRAQTAIPEPQLLRIPQMDHSVGAAWSGGFGAAPARFGEL